MSRLDDALLGSGVAFTIVLAMLVVFHYHRPVTVQYVPQKPSCNDIIRYEDGSLVCEIDLQAEDDAAPSVVPREI